MGVYKEPKPVLNMPMVENPSFPPLVNPPPDELPNDHISHES